MEALAQRQAQKQAREDIFAAITSCELKAEQSIPFHVDGDYKGDADSFQISIHPQNLLVHC